MIPAREAARTISRWRGEAVVVAASSALREWVQVSERRELDVDLHDCPDKVAAVGLGIGLARPDVKVLVLDNDAALRMNPSAMATVGSLGPENLVHIVFEDESYSSTGGLAIPGLGGLDYVKLAKDYGYRRAFRFDELEELALSLDELLGQPGPILVSVKVFHGDDLPPGPEGTTAQSMDRVKGALGGG